MLIEVLIAQTEGEGSVRKWLESGSYPKRDEWERTALGLAYQARDQREFRADIFLCLKADSLIYEFEYDLCRALSDVARRYGWGAKLYIAVDETIDLKPEQLSVIPHLIAWLSGVHDGRQRPTDILLANFDRMIPLQPYHLSDLRRARDESVRRYEIMPGLIIPDQWYCWAASEEYQAWLEGVSADRARNLIIVIKDGGSAVKRAVRFAREKLEQCPGDRFVLGCLGSGSLSGSIVELSRKYKIPILRFRGLVELRYFLMRLNSLCRGQGLLAPLSQSVEAVPLGRPVFHFGSVRRPRLLITSAFHPGEYETNCLDAVTDVGIVSRAAPADAECYVHPYFRAADLPGLLKRMPELTAWLHLGHGDASGLRDIAGDIIKLDEWLASLQYSAARLPLLVLSVCESATTARRFAEAGVGVVIGFERKVLPELCRSLAEAVVPAALTNAGSHEAILRAYNEALKRHAENVAVSGPRAYYSVL